MWPASRPRKRRPRLPSQYFAPTSRSRQHPPRRRRPHSQPGPKRPRCSHSASASALSTRCRAAQRLMPDLAMARDGQKLTRRVADALAQRAPLAGLPISVQSHGDVVTLGGQVPSAYEAMLAYRTVEQTPGVREITDQLQFQVPDENHPNPLRQKGRPEDLEPYLTSQIRRHVGELATWIASASAAIFSRSRARFPPVTMSTVCRPSSDPCRCSATSAWNPPSTPSDRQHFSKPCRRYAASKTTRPRKAEGYR